MDQGDPLLLMDKGTEENNPDVGQTSGNQDAGEPLRVCDMALVQMESAAFVVGEEGFDGMITNDKFCLTRNGELELSWWRRPLRLRESNG
jgi:hypothetical protein